MELKLCFLLMLATVSQVCLTTRIDHRYVNITDVEINSDEMEFKVSLNLTAIEKLEESITKRPHHSDDNKFKIVCHFDNQAWYYPGNRKFTPEQIDENLCTHVVYQYAALDPTSLTIKVNDPLVDIDNGFYRRITDLKKKGIHVLISIGGSIDSVDDEYSRLVRDPDARARFVADVIEFIKNYNFDGLNLEWRYPVWRSGEKNEKHLFADLVRELSKAFRRDGLLLSIFVSSLHYIIAMAYDIPQLSKYVNWISVTTYSYHGHWEHHTGHFASFDSTKFSMRYWIEHGAARDKLLMGLSTRGATFILEDESKHGFLAPVKVGGGEPGEFTQHKGYLSFYEIMDKVNHFFTVQHDHLEGTYAYFRNIWISYDDVGDIQRKAQYIREENLGGAMISAVNEDEFLEDTYKPCGKYPLMTAVNQILRNDHDPNDKLNNCT